MNKTERITPDRPKSIVWNETCDIVYVRSNIVSHGDYYTFDEYKYNSRDFSSMYFEQLRADIDYISMMAEVDL